MPGTVRRRRQDAADEALVRALFEEHGRAMLAYAMRLTGERGSAEDAVQEALVRAWRNMDNLLNREGSVRGWLLTVTRNIVLDQARARKSRPIEVAETPSIGPVQSDHAEQVVDTLVVLDALESLSAAHRDVLEQVYLRGLSVGEAAQTLGIPAGTVKSRSHYALRALQEWFDKEPAVAGEAAS